MSDIEEQREYYERMMDEVGEEYRRRIADLEAENAKLREYVTKLEQSVIVLDSGNCELRNDMEDMQFFINENRKLRELCEWLLTPYRLGAVTGEGVDKQWCRETYDGGSYRLRELGVDA